MVVGRRERRLGGSLTGSRERTGGGGGEEDPEAHATGQCREAERGPGKSGPAPPTAPPPARDIQTRVHLLVSTTRTFVTFDLLAVNTAEHCQACCKCRARSSTCPVYTRCFIGRSNTHSALSRALRSPQLPLVTGLRTQRRSGSDVASSSPSSHRGSRASRAGANRTRPNRANRTGPRRAN